ncbi:hypothetical protein [Streptomyces sp. L2]|uniref:hypothetical protein n=1 Tax=Streptomyces sp. L2 TaxID=2162665 RepID=UPI0010101D44|nr:hypothetical protein [Streptomyces sp. L2]
MSVSAAVRSLRAAVFAAVCVLLAAAGHGLAMGDLPPLWADGAGFLAVSAVCWLLGGRERSLAGIGAAMLLTQAGLHVAFDAASRISAAAHAGAGMSGRSMGDSVMAGHMMPGMGTPAAHTGHAVTAHALTGHASAAHLLAALLASWLLRRGEAALWALLRRAGRLVPGLVAWWRDAPLPESDRRAVGTPDGPAPYRPALLRHAVSRRGPPVTVA